jgi:ABC-type microcin C transport system duplicated ATPase subunit YejF
VDDLLIVEDLHTRLPTTGGRTAGVVNGVSLRIAAGQTLGVVGESGCGKTTLARTLLRLIPASSGRVTFEGRAWLGLNSQELRTRRRRMQIVFQDPAGSLNPRWRVGRIIGEGLAIHEPRLAEAQRRARIEEMLVRVGLARADFDRWPHEFSGGQRQRIGIARALIVRPALVICDEPVSALDVSVQSQILNLLSDLQAELGIAYLFIAHNLAVVRQFCDHVAVMHAGRIVEQAAAERIFSAPQHAYTQRLLAAVPRLGGAAYAR